MFYNVYSSLCEERGEKPYTVARIIGLKSYSAIVAKWKKGSTPNGETLSRIAAYFDVPVEYLLTGDEKFRMIKKEQPAQESGLSEWYRTMLSVCQDLSEEDKMVVLTTAQALKAAHDPHRSDKDK